MSEQFTNGHHAEELRCAACQGDGGAWEVQCPVCGGKGLLKVLVPDPPLLTLAELEQRHVQLVLAAHNGNKTQTAKTLGIDRRSVYRRLATKSRKFRSKRSA